MNYVLVCPEDFVIPAGGNASGVSLSRGVIPYFITSYQYLRKDQYSFQLIRDVVTENMSGLFHENNKFLIKRELFERSSDLYFQREDNFNVPMLKTTDIPLFSGDPHIVMFMSQPVAVDKTIINMTKVNEDMSDPFKMIDFISKYGVGTPKLYSVQKRNMVFGRTYDIEQPFFGNSNPNNDMRVDLVTLDTVGILDTNYSSAMKFPVPSPQLTKSNKGRFVTVGVAKADGS